jgi:D-amino-acid oxidase
MVDDRSAGRLSRRTMLGATGGAAAAGLLGVAHGARGGSRRSVAVIGAGVVGLQAARVFAALGDSVTIYAAEITPGTTSDVAAAIIFPHLVPPTPPVLEAVRRTNDYYAVLVDAGVGVHPRSLTFAMDTRDVEAGLLPFGPLYPAFEELPPGRVPGGYRFGWRVETWWVDSRTFMPYLMQRALDLGVALIVRRFARLADVLALPHEVVVNCTGLGAGALVGDTAVYPIKGQLVTVLPMELVDPIIHGESSHIFPRDDSAVLGGTHSERIFDVDSSEAVTEEIVTANRRVAPSLSRDQVIGVRAGLRPFREGGPRLEAETVDGKRLLHNYGHGGSGWTLAPGCAEMLPELLDR